LFHFKQKASGNYSLAVSYFNPLLYALVSYFILMQKANWLALLIYTALGFIHLYLAGRFRKLEDLDTGFEDITNNNLTLGLLFITASLTFIPFFTVTDQFFFLVTSLYFLQAFVLLHFSFKTDFNKRIIRRFSYFTLLLVWIQLISVVSWMPQSNLAEFIHKFSIYFTSIFLFFLYFKMIYNNRELAGREDNAMMAISLISSCGIMGYLTYDFYSTNSMLLISSLIGYIILYASFRYNDRMASLRYLNYVIMITICIFLPIIEIVSTHLHSADYFVNTIQYLTLAGVFVLNLYTLYKFRNNIPDNELFIINMSAFAPALIIFIITYRVFDPFFVLFLTSGLLLLLTKLSIKLPCCLSELKDISIYLFNLLSVILLFWPIKNMGLPFFNIRFASILGIILMAVLTWYSLTKIRKYLKKRVYLQRYIHGISQQLLQ
jgi:hypothetical protein